MVVAAIILFVFGTVVGSFLNVLIDRLPLGQDILWSRSHCDYCKKVLRWFELIPIVSFIIQKGRCRRCHKKLSIQYPLVEVVEGIIFLFLGFQNYHPNFLWLDYLGLIGGLVGVSSLFVIFVSDLKYQIIPDSILVAGMAGFTLVFLTNPVRVNLQNSLPFLFSGLIAAGLFLFLWFITKGHGMGLGDVKLAFLLGLILGFPNILIVIYLAFLTGAAVGVILVLFGKKSLKSRIAFGPYLILSSLIAARWGAVMWLWWKGIL